MAMQAHPFLRMMLSQLVLMLLMNWSLSSAQDALECVSPQYVKLGETGVLHCNFFDFFGIFWYNSTDYINSYSIVNLKGERKSGHGFDSGEFDIYPNGSLVISRVSLQHDHQFSVLKFKSSSDQPIPIFIRAIVFVVPDPAFPLIEDCPRFSEVCLKEVDFLYHLNCSVNHARPPFDVNLLEKVGEGYSNVSQQFFFKRENFLYTSVSTLTVALSHTNFISLFVCRASAPPYIFKSTESTVLLTSGTIDLMQEAVTQKFVSLHSVLRLECSMMDIEFVVWKKSTFSPSAFKTLALGFYSGETFKYQNFSDFELHENGSLTAVNFQFHQEGIYLCLFSDGVHDGLTLYEVIGTVFPESTNPVVDGCTERNNCEIKVYEEGVLSCSLSGIRPLIQLDWKTDDEKSSSLVIFTEKKSSSISRGNTFDVNLTTKFKIRHYAYGKVVIVCAVSGKYQDILQSETKVTLHLMKTSENDTERESTSSSLTDANKVVAKKWIWFGCLAVAAVVFLLYAIFVRKVERYGRLSRTSEEIQHLEGGEGQEMDDKRKTNQYTDELTSSQRKRETFTRLLKEKYEVLYNGIRPIPYVWDHMCCVDKVFVEGGIQISDFQRHKKSSKSWDNLKTYTDMLDSKDIVSKRRLVEADPGYGKSTTTLQIAYDWCNPEGKSSFFEGKLLVLLRLRQLGGVSSIYEAIKTFILTKDSQLQVDDIRHILQQDHSSLIFLLDGYDEYPDHESCKGTDLYHILMSNMFRESIVILTTRKRCLPRQFDPRSARLRLTGFNDNACQKYIRKAVVSNDETAVTRIMSHIKEDPVLYDLCQTPLFFVMTAHIIYEKENVKFSSVTEFFQYLVKCFHEHTKHKMDETHEGDIRMYETDRTRHDLTLEKLAFGSLSKSTKTITWQRDHLCKHLHEEFVLFYERIGFFVREDACIETEIRFYHKLFCEWFAAKHIITKNLALNVHELVKEIDPKELMFVYRFACGIKPDIAEQIIGTLKDEYKDIAILCFLELPADAKDVTSILTQLCSLFITIKGDDNKLLQRAKIHLLESASSRKIFIKHLLLHECFDYVEEDTVEKVTLLSSHRFCYLKTLQKMEFVHYGRPFTMEELTAILKFAAQCTQLKTIKFSYCLLPYGVDGATLKSVSGLKVKWYVNGQEQYQLNLETGLWQTRLTKTVVTKGMYEQLKRAISRHARGTKWEPKSSSDHASCLTAVEHSQSEL